MNRTLTAAVALAASLGTAGLAHAQSSAGPSTTPNTMSPGMPSTTMTPPTTSQQPNAAQDPGAMSNPNTSYRSQAPQANTQPNQGQANQAQMNQGGPQNASQSQIQQAQQQLKQQGLYNGAIDGVVGPETESALAQFQREQGLPQTAQLDQQTLGRLMNGPSAGSSQNQERVNSGATQPMTSPYPAGTQNPATPNGNR